MALSTHLKKTVALLTRGSTEEAIAAAVVLGAIAPKEKAVVNALSRALVAKENLPLALASARALGRIGNPTALSALLPLLEASGELRETGALAIAGCGRAALPAVRQALSGADFRRRVVLYRILARMHTAESLRLVLDAFFDSNFEMVKAAGRALRNEVATMTPAERKTATKTALAFLKSRGVKESRPATNSVLLYLGALAHPDAVTSLLRYTDPSLPRATRRHALQALRHTLLETRVPARVAETLFPFLDDPDFEAVVEPSLAILEHADLSPTQGKELARLVRGRYPAVRQFAVRKLAASDTKKGTELLLDLLDGTDQELRRSAVRALRGSKRAPSLLLPRLLAEKNPDAAWSLVHLIKPNASQLSSAERKKLGSTALRYLDKGDRRAEPLLHLYRHTDDDAYARTFLDRAQKAKKAKKYAEAERNLRLIAKSPHMDGEARFQLALLSLLAGGSDLSPSSPKTREALVALRRSAQAPGFELEAHLKKETRTLGPAGLYAVGFGLVEGRGALREVGAKLLRAQVKKYPRTKVGKMARAKLQTEGLA